MKKKNLPLIENIEITGIAAEGKAITHYNDCVVFAPYCIPGDIADLQVTKKKHNYMEARVARIVTPSALRLTPICKHYGECGGCKWQILPYEEQLKYKQQQVYDNLTRIGHLTIPEISPILGSSKTYQYRNKLEFSFADKRWVSWDEIHAAGGIENVTKDNALGFHIPNCFDKILNIDECYLMDDINNRIRNFIREYAIEYGLSFFNPKSQNGLMRNIIIRTNSQKQVMLIVVFGEENNKKCNELLEAISKEFTEIVSLIYIINTKCNDSISDLPVHCYCGSEYIIETMENLQFKVGPKSFYQTNTAQAYELYKVARQFAGLTGKELVYDLYTGTGTIANFVAHQARQVIGIEYVPEAIEDAKENSKLNGIENTLFFAGDMKDILTEQFISQYGKPDVIITDPPRAGMHEDVVNTILSAAPEKIVYVSCNTATQARDLAMLCQNEAYTIKAIQPVDMFPQTHHCENVVLLERGIVQIDDTVVG